ncbi:hypothetical protein AMECASPLE_034800 [Ameca splendens]|uniref:Uncharacterized protein n=1 Tax=Ameca splendens TaxID=208324 RepID=A0ABV0XW13_9TELE
MQAPRRSVATEMQTSRRPAATEMLASWRPAATEMLVSWRPVMRPEEPTKRGPLWSAVWPEPWQTWAWRPAWTQAGDLEVGQAGWMTLQELGQGDGLGDSGTLVTK